MDRKYLCYKLLRPYGLGLPAYIGIGGEHRPKEHEKAARVNRHPNKILQRIFNKAWKLGFDGLIIQVIERNMSWTRACEVEKKQIALFGRLDLGSGSLANMSAGGDGIFDMSEDSILRRNLASKRPHSFLAKEKMKKPKSVETRIKMRKPKSIEHRLHISQGKKNKKLGPMTEKHRLNIISGMKEMWLRVKQQRELERLLDQYLSLA
jgi:hypothetical protein